MTNKINSIKSTSKTKKERSLISKLLWTVIFPFLAPYMFKIGGKENKELLAIIILILTLGFNLYAQDILSSTEISKAKYNLQETSFIQNTYKISRTISEFQAFNKEIDNLYLKIGYVTASAITPIPLGKLGMLVLGKSQNSYEETIIKGSFNYSFEGDKLAGSCEVVISQENFGKLNNIASYRLGVDGNGVNCEFSWGYKIHGGNPDSFGWAHTELKKTLQQHK